MSSTQHRHEDLHDLMDAYVDGDQRAFARLHERLEPKLRGRLIKMVGRPAVVDDLVQLTFLRAHVARERFEPMPDRSDRAVEAWYGAIARNVALDHMRQSYRRERRHDALAARGDVRGMGVPATRPTAEEVSVQREETREVAQVVRQAIAGLPPTQREVVQLHKLRGMSMSDIGERLGVRPGALRVRAHRAYRSLANAIRRIRPELEPA